MLKPLVIHKRGSAVRGALLVGNLQGVPTVEVGGVHAAGLCIGAAHVPRAQDAQDLVSQGKGLPRLVDQLHFDDVDHVVR